MRRSGDEGRDHTQNTEYCRLSSSRQLGESCESGPGYTDLYRTLPVLVRVPPRPPIRYGPYIEPIITDTLPVVFSIPLVEDGPSDFPRQDERTKLVLFCFKWT